MAFCGQHDGKTIVVQLKVEAPGGDVAEEIGREAGVERTHAAHLYYVPRSVPITAILRSSDPFDAPALIHCTVTLTVTHRTAVVKYRHRLVASYQQIAL